MPEELTKQAASIGETLKKVWNENEAYHPGAYGALGGAAFAGLGTMGRRANENPRQRALRILRNAAAGGLLGGAGFQLAAPGFEKVVDSMANPNNQTPPSKPGILSSIPARLGYAGTTALAGSKIFRRRNLLKSLESMLPTAGLGQVSYLGAPAQGGIAPIHSLNFENIKGNNAVLQAPLRREAAVLADKLFQGAARNDPKGFNNLLSAIEQKTMSGNGVVDKNLSSFLRDNYYRGERGHAVNARGAMRALNFLGASAPNRWLRGLGGLGSVGALGAAASLPDIANIALEETGEQVDKAPSRMFTNPLADTPAPAPSAPEPWYAQLTKGRRFF